MFSVQFECRDCGWWTLCGAAQTVRRLRKLGLFRRATDPPDEMVREVLVSHGSRLACDRCGKASLQVRLDADDAGRGEWEQVIVCEICREPIPIERLEFMPNARRCACCQDATDRGQSFAEPEFCPRCGSLVELRVSRGGGVARYKLWCTGNPPCRL